MKEARFCGIIVSNVTHVIETRRPDIVIIDKEDKNCFIVDIAIPRDSRFDEKEGKEIPGPEERDENVEF